MKWEAVPSNDVAREAALNYTCAWFFGTNNLKAWNLNTCKDKVKTSVTKTYPDFPALTMHLHQDSIQTKQSLKQKKKF